MDESCRFKDNDAMSPKKEMQTHLGRETGRDSLRPSGPIRNLLFSAVWSSKYKASEQASSRFGCLRKPNRTPQLQDEPECSAEQCKCWDSVKNIWSKWRTASWPSYFPESWKERIESRVGRFRLKQPCSCVSRKGNPFFNTHQKKRSSSTAQNNT